MGNTGLDMHSVTDIAMEEDLNNLNASTEQEGKEKYLKQIAEVLSNANYVSTGLEGAFIDIYNPMVDGKTFENIAVKFTDIKDKRNSIGIKRLYQDMHGWEAYSIINDHGYFLSLNHPGGYLRQDLTGEEKELLYFAHEHKMYQQLYGDYVLPSVFVAFPLKNDIKNKEGKVFKKKGDIATVMVQDLENVRLIGREPKFTDWKTLNSNEVDNIEKFTNKIEEIFLSTGYYPDEEILENGNMGLLPNGNVVLLDTNVLNIYQNRILSGLGIAYPISKLRKQIEEYRRNKNKILK